MIRIELLHQRVYNFRGMTISDQCMSIENLLDEVVFNQVASSYVDSWRKRNFSHYKRT